MSIFLQNSSGKMIVKAMVLFAFLLSGCQSLFNSQQSPPPPAVTESPAPVATQPANPPAPSEPDSVHDKKYNEESEKLKQCQAQLEALKTMNPGKYKNMRTSFDFLMNGAAQYSGMRQNTNADTQDTVDALYRYRANLLCSQIAQTLLDSLSRRGEARP